jgi:hypothetical protein
MSDERLDRLSDMARMVLDAGTAKLRRAAAARDRVQAEIDRLDAARPAEAPRDAAEAGVALAYETWAGRRKAVLNVELAARRAACLALSDEARRAFGRAQVIDRLVALRRG